MFCFDISSCHSLPIDIIIHFLFNESYSEDSDVRFRSISTMTKIKEKTYIEICLDRFIEIMESEPYLCKVGLLYRFDENDLKNTKVKYIFDLGKVDNYYWVRHAANRFDKANIR